MTLEVRQLVLKASVGADDPAAESCGASACPGAQWEDTSPDQLKQDILAACQRWMQDVLRQQRER